MQEHAFSYQCLFNGNFLRRTKTSNGKGDTKSLKWISSKVEELADSNGNIAAEKLKEQMRQTQVRSYSFMH